MLRLQSADELRFATFLATAAVAASWKVRLPGVPGTASVSFLFVLVAIVDLSLPEALTLGVVSVLVQCYWHARTRPRLIQLAFNTGSVALAISCSAFAYSEVVHRGFGLLALVILALAYYFANTLAVAGIIALTENRSLANVWAGYKWLFPYYVAGSSLAWLLSKAPAATQWEIPIICLPIVFLIHRSYRNYLKQVAHEKKHFQDMNSLHLQTIEALALAIEAKDQTTHEHLQRVQVYAVEIGKDLGISKEDLEALRAAAVLHDIGKLAVPDSIICKPGKLTRAEFEKMKIHPVVGSEILKRVEFPYPVVPIVRAHHEKWNGSGYPDGLEGEQIPIGARILSAVDALDALASDRQYRQALPLDEAMAHVSAEAGVSFDPAVVNALSKRYRELERRARAFHARRQRAEAKHLQIVSGGAPATGFEQECEIYPLPCLPGISASTQPVLTLEESLAVLTVRLESVLSFDAIAFFASTDGVLKPEFAAGDEHAMLDSLRIPVGTGIAGQVAETGNAVLNADPGHEHGYRGAMHSMLAIPLVERSRPAGVLAVYRTGEYAFTAEELSALMPVSRQAARLILENGRKRVAYSRPANARKPELAQSAWLVAPPA